jgi:acyl dehydratase
MMYYEDYAVGIVMNSPSYTVTQQELVAFATKWDPQPFHVDEAAGKAAFGGLITCSAHTFSIFSYLGSRLDIGSDGAIVAGLGFNRMQMIKPIYVGDNIRLRAEVTKLRRSQSNPSQGIMTTNNHLYNQKDELVFSVETATLMKVKEPQPA